MSKLKSDKIAFADEDYVVEIGKTKHKKSQKEILVEKFQQEFCEAKLDSQKTEEEKTQQKSQMIVEQAQEQAQNILEEAKKEAEKIIQQAQQQAQQEKENILNSTKEDAQKEVEEIISTAKEDIEKERVETINKAYEEGYEDAHQKLLEEVEEKIKFFDNFCASQYQIEKNILKAASKDILDIINAISKKVLLKELDGKILDKIIKNTVTLLENKDNVNIILSEKYARILYEYQKKSLNKEIEFNFEDFKQYENFNIIYSPEYKDDTIIIENFKERFNSSINSQLEIIIRDIYENAQKEQLEIEEYKQIHEID